MYYGRLQRRHCTRQLLTMQTYANMPMLYVVVVIDHADTVSAYQWLYSDITMTKWTLMANFEGFSQILKEHSGEKSTWVCLHTQYQG